MKKVFLYAYDKQNLGDDLFVHAITKRYPSVKFYMITDAKNKKTYEELKNLRIINKESVLFRFFERIRPSLKSWAKAYLEKRCDATVFIGGSIFIEYETWEQSLTWWDYESKNRNFYVLGANFGPYKTDAYKESLSNIFRKMKCVCFRDKYSFSLFSNIPTVKYAPDILFGIEMPKRLKTDKNVFVSVIDCENRKKGMDSISDNEEVYLNNTIRIIKDSLINGYSVTLSSFCKEEGDEITIKKILDFLDEDEKKKIFVFNYNGTNVKEILQCISDSDFVVASRFHAMILGFVACKPVFPIVYSSKTLNVIDDISFSGKYWDLRTDKNVNIHFNDLQNQTLKYSRSIIEQSKEHFIMLDDILH
jgi:colanic acid/amylovoran biosynthesis protein